MSDDQAIRHLGIKIEEVNDNLLRFMEAMSSIPSDVANLKADVRDIKSEMQLFRVLWRDHEGRITKLETS